MTPAFHNWLATAPDVKLILEHRRIERWMDHMVGLEHFPEFVEKRERFVAIWQELQRRKIVRAEAARVAA